MNRKVRSNRWILQNMGHLDERRDKLAALRAQRKKLDVTIEELIADINLLERANCVYDGIALRVDEAESTYGRCLSVGLIVAPDLPRREALVYANAHNNGETFGLRLSEYGRGYGEHNTPSQSGGLWIGSHFSWDEAETMAFQWVAHGVIPKERKAA